MTKINLAYVDFRFLQFVQKYKQVLEKLIFDKNYIEKYTNLLDKRLKQKDFKVYGDKPVNYLHGGKRITRFYIKCALEECQKYKNYRELLYIEYSNKIKENNPNTTFFSFESAYSKQLKINFSDYKEFFKI